MGWMHAGLASVHEIKARTFTCKGQLLVSSHFPAEEDM
jgi:hypothetical protein